MKREQPSLEIELKKNTIVAIQSNLDDKEEKLLDDLMSQKHLIVKLLKNYEDQQDHRGQISDFEPVENIEIDSQGSGGMTVHFTVNIYSGCRDQVLDYEDEVYVSIEIDPLKRVAKLIGQELMPQREPDDY